MRYPSRWCRHRLITDDLWRRRISCGGTHIAHARAEQRLISEEITDGEPAAAGPDGCANAARHRKKIIHEHEAHTPPPRPSTAGICDHRDRARHRRDWRDAGPRIAGAVGTALTQTTAAANPMVRPMRRRSGPSPDAMVRLLIGIPLRSDGQLTVKSLAEKAGPKRNQLTHKHTGLNDLVYALLRARGTQPLAIGDSSATRARVVSCSDSATVPLEMLVADHVADSWRVYGRQLAYDAPAESIRLITDGVPDQPVRLSRRRRFAPIAVDVEGDIAAARFLRRGAGCFWDEIHLLVADGCGGWRVLGGGGSSSGHEDRTAAGFERARDDLTPHQVLVNAGASVLRDSDRLLPWTQRWVRSTTVLASHGITQLAVRGRHVPVPYHGHLIIVWDSRRPPSATAHDAAGRPIVTINLSDGH
jgi:hypothetical protein